MKVPSLPANERARLGALEQLGVLDTPAEQEFDELSKLAATILQTPIALVSLVDADRQWFKSRYGLEVSETPRVVSFCGHVVESDEPLVVRDTLEDERFADNPLVRQAPHIRFYAGEPLRNRDGFVFGTLCAIDRRPRDLSEEQRSSLRVLANQVSLLLELRRRAKLLAENQASLALFHQFFLQGRDLKYALELTTGDLVLNPAWVTTTGWTLDELKGGLFSELIHPDDATATRLAIDGLVEGADAKFENRCRAMDGTWIWLSWIVQSRDGRLLATGRSPAPRARICRRCRGS